MKAAVSACEGKVRMSRAYIFDFDGVLVNTMSAHFSAYQQALAEVDVPLDKEQFYRQAGMTGREQIRCFAEKAGVSVDVDRVYERTRQIRREQPQPTDAIVCNVELLHLLRSAGVPVAIATGSSRPSILPIMREHGIEADAIVTAEDIQRGKPFPDLLLRAAGALGNPPEECVVIEDSEVGIEAARAAGMRALRFHDRSK
jgi:HAD superfamily hydrolase (TIGR01509 family)